MEVTHGASIYMSADWSSAIEEVIASCDECDIPLVMRIAPICVDMKGLLDTSPLEKRLSELSARHPNVECKPAIEFYERRLCWDMSHLNTTGIAKFIPVVAADVIEVTRRKSGR
jgi:hypothetical protein